MGVIFNNLRVGGLGAGDKEFEEGRGLGAAWAQLGSWHMLGILAGGVWPARPMGRDAKGWPRDTLVLEVVEWSGYGLRCLFTGPLGCGQGQDWAGRQRGSPGVLSQGKEPPLLSTESRPGPGWPSHCIWSQAGWLERSDTSTLMTVRTLSWSPGRRSGSSGRQTCQQQGQMWAPAPALLLTWVQLGQRV